MYMYVFPLKISYLVNSVSMCKTTQHVHLHVLEQEYMLPSEGVYVCVRVCVCVCVCVCKKEFTCNSEMFTNDTHQITTPYAHTHTVVPDDETYRVSLRKSNSIMFSGPCLFEILRDFDRNLFHIAIFTDEKPPRLVVKWQIDHIRQYGSNQMAFKFESGR